VVAAWMAMGLLPYRAKNGIGYLRVVRENAHHVRGWTEPEQADPQVPATERRRPVQVAAPPRVGPNGERQRRSKKTEPGPFGPSGDKTMSLSTA
jgi:hypothetical protein